MDDFMAAVQQCAEEYEQQYKPDLQRRQAERAALEQRRQEAELERLKADRQAGAGTETAAGAAGAGAAAAGGASRSGGGGGERMVLDGGKGATLQQLQEEEEGEEQLATLD